VTGHGAVFDIDLYRGFVLPEGAARSSIRWDFGS